MKKIVGILAIVIFSFGLVGCGDKKEEAKETQVTKESVAVESSSSETEESSETSVSSEPKEEQNNVYVLEQNGATIELTYYFKGDKVTKQETRNTLPYLSLGVANKEEAEEMMGAAAEQFQNIEGLTHSFEYEEDQMLEFLAIDYQVVDFDEIAELDGMQFDESAKTFGISMKKSEELLLEQGYVKQ